MRLWIYLALLLAVGIPTFASKKEAANPFEPSFRAPTSLYEPSLHKAPGDIETSLDRPEFDLERAFDGSSPNASIDLYSGALIIQAQDLHLPGPYGVNLEINRDFNGKVYIPRADELRVRKADSWVGVGWSLNWGVLNLEPTFVVFELSGYPAQRMFLATDGTGTDLAGNPTHDYRFLSPITGDLIRPYMSKDFWRAWREPSQTEGDPIWYVQNTDGKLFQIEKVDHAVGTYATTRIWHPKSPNTDIRFEYQDGFVRITQRPDFERTTEVLVHVNEGALASIRAGSRTLTYQVSRCGGTPEDPEERNCLAGFINGEGERTEYDYGSQVGNWDAELDKITTPMGGVYTYDYADQEYYHSNSETGLYNTRVVRGWKRGDQEWAYQYEHPTVDTYDDSLNFYTSTRAVLTTTVEGPEDVRRQHVFWTYGGSVIDGARYTTFAHDAGRLIRTAEFHQEVWNLNVITGAQYRLVTALTENGNEPAIFFTRSINPEDGKVPFIPLSAGSINAFLPADDISAPDAGDRTNPMLLNQTILRFATEGETPFEEGSTVVWISDPYGRPEEVLDMRFNRKAPGERHIKRNELKYETTEAQKTNNQVFLVSEDRLYHNGPDDDDQVVVTQKAFEAGTPATLVERSYNDFGDQTEITTHDLVTDQQHRVLTPVNYESFQVSIVEPFRDDMRVRYRSGLPSIVQVRDSDTWITLRTAEYDIYGNMVSWTNSLNQTSTFEYDRADRIRFERYPLMEASETRYTIQNGAVVRRQVGTSGPWEELSFDVFGRKTDHRKSEIPNAQFTYEYDALDRLVNLTHPNGGIETRKYDTLNRITELKRTRDDREEIQRWQFWDGLSVMHTDAQGNQTFKRDDGGSAPAMFFDQTGALTEIYTDAFGRVVRVEHGTAVRTRKYSGLGHLLEEYHPETGLQKLQYNSAGDVAVSRYFSDADQSNGPHKVHRFEYDGRGRIKRQYPDSQVSNPPFIRWEYDDENLVSIHNQEADVVFDYDGANRLAARHFTLRQAHRSTLTTRYGYTPEGHLEWMEYPSGSRVTHAFDNGKHLSGASVSTAFGTGTMVEDLEYTPGLGQSPNPVPRAWKLGNQTQEDRFFGPYGRPFAEEVNQNWVGGQRVIRKVRKFDILGRVTTHESFSGEGDVPSQVAEYGYDTLSRLVRADYRDQQTGHAQFDEFYYDLDNNLLAYGGNGENTPMQYPVTADFNEDGEISVADLHGFTFGEVDSGNAEFSRDLDGDGKVTLLDAAKQGINVAPFATPEEPVTNRLVGWEFTFDGNVSRTPDGKQYAYNTWNQLVGFGANERLAYGPESNRILEWREGDSSKKLTLFSDSGDPIAEYRLDGGSLTLTKETFYFGGKPVVSDIYESDGPDCHERVWFHSDYLGSPTDYTDDSGSLAGFQSFAAFGQKWTSDMECVPVGRGFTGHQGLADSDLTWMKARSYSNRYGRFLQPDPVTITLGRLADPGELNLYTYVDNSPTLAVDPKGEWVWHAAGAVIGGGADLTAQLITNGGDWDKVSWASVGGSAVAGAFGGGALRATAKLGGSVLKAVGKEFTKELAGNVTEEVIPVPIPGRKPKKGPKKG
ncbi:RHS repeat domain-containing protein [Acanthopleuribacter pedis]|uniref:Uncharacterized protein n=1 Tax=Acanthopleuribacter pedis TaxID=442870 RepID=A0A8J7U6A3_9BACT|nr:RHS repeat-associated core domain-containing protein [Acanthopleuribacter pedis]MBO1323403.1 hypothetical protein [Acanthopleuribacter pedis]